MKTELGPNGREDTFSTQRRKDARAQSGATPFLASLLLCVFALIPTPSPAATNDLTATLQRGLFEEEANHNLDAAAQAYQAVSTQFDQDRALAATAIFRLGEIYRKQNKTNEAVAQYERIVREFSDQQTLATLSRQNLTGLHPPGPADLATAQPPPVTGPFIPDDEEKEIRRIQEMIKNSPDLINAPGMSDVTPLCRAAGAGWLRVAGFLLDHGAAVNRPSNNNSTPLHLAAAAGHRGMVELLADHGADLEARDGTGATALWIAAQKGFLSVAEALAQRKADVQARNSEKNGGQTPLHAAAKAGNPTVVAFLVAKGADVQSQDHTGMTALAVAARFGQTDVINKLLALGAKPDVPDKSGRTALSYAAERGPVGSVKALLTAKADPNAGEKDLPLVTAARLKQLEIARLLLDAGAKPNLAGKTSQPINAPGQPFAGYPPGGTFGPYGPLPVAVAQGDAAMVKLLLEFKADATVSGPWEAPARPLTKWAVTQPEILKALLDAGADANAEVSDKLSLLHQACAIGDAAAVEILLAHGANPNARSFDGRTPLTLAAERNCVKCVELLLEAKADPNLAPTNGTTALQWAVIHGGKEMVEALIARGANVNQKGERGNTPLHSAAWIGSRGIGAAKMTELLLSKGADPNVRNDEGQTPLDIAQNKQPRLPDRVASLPPPSGLPPRTETQPVDLAGLLREHGALDELPDFNSLRVTRAGWTQPWVVFRKDTNSVNQFTLLEVILNFYGISGDNRGMPFPDFSKLIVHRPRAGQPGTEQELKFNLLTGTNRFDCAKDTWLKFGDVVEIPEREHALSESPVGLTADQQAQLRHCLAGKVTLVVRGQKAELTLDGTAETCRLEKALGRMQNMLRSSSDLSRIKIQRTDPVTGKATEFFANGKLTGADDLWLRNGDVIEVPDKP